MDRVKGKALVDIAVREGPRYRIGTFEVTGSRHYSSEDLARSIPSAHSRRRLPARSRVCCAGAGPMTTPTSIRRAGRGDAPGGRGVRERRYIYATVRPVVQRVTGRTAPHGEPAVGGGRAAAGDRERVEVLGNDITSESCIRNQIFVVPGRRVPPRGADPQLPEHRQPGLLRDAAARAGHQDRQRQRRRGRDLPREGEADGQRELRRIGGAGRRRRRLHRLRPAEPVRPLQARLAATGSSAQYINDFSLSYTDPFIRRVAGLRDGHAPTARRPAVLRQQRRPPDARLAARCRSACRCMGSRFSRDLRVVRGGAGELRRSGRRGREQDQLRPRHLLALHARLSIRLTTRAIGLPFPTDGGDQNLVGAGERRFFGGARTRATRGRCGTTHRSRSSAAGRPARADGLGARPQGPRRRGVRRRRAASSSRRSSRSAACSTASRLRGYEEFSITPNGLRDRARRRHRLAVSSFGNAFFTDTVELGLRFNQQFYLDVFYDAGNIWARPQDFNPTRLFRGAGVGASVVTPLGPLGLDWAYGFDRVENGVQGAQVAVAFQARSALLTLEYSCVCSFARRPPRSPLTIARRGSARSAQSGAEVRLHPLVRAARSGAGPRRSRSAVRQGDGRCTASRSSG